MKYTVLLIRPDYVASDYGQDTYLAHVEAEDPEEAGLKAQYQAALTDYVGGTEVEFQEELEQGGIEVTDYYVAAVFEGHLNDLAEH